MSPFDPKETLALPQPVDQLSLTTLREMLIEIGAKVARLGRYFTFELAVAAIPRVSFAEIRQPIDGLRPAPLPPSWGSIQKHPDRPTREIWLASVEVRPHCRRCTAHRL